MTDTEKIAELEAKLNDLDALVRLGLKALTEGVEAQSKQISELLSLLGVD